MLRALLRLMRPAQWTKNVFVLAPIVFAQQLGDLPSLRRALTAFALFCVASSAVYVFNDIRDREEDRRHPVKRDRPLASGALGPGTAAVLGGLLAAVALGGGWVLGRRFALIVAVYLAVNLFYTLGLKHVVILDVMLVSLGFVLRVLGGAEAVAVDVSAWLLLCTIFVALFLSFSKRRHELLLLEAQAAGQRRVLTHYSPDFLDQMTSVVTASTVVAYALYCVAPETAERAEGRELVYTIPFVLFGIFRYLYLAYQRPSERSPTEAIQRDLPSVINLLLWAALVVLIFYWP